MNNHSNDISRLIPHGVGFDPTGFNWTDNSVKQQELKTKVAEFKGRTYENMSEKTIEKKNKKIDGILNEGDKILQKMENKLKDLKLFISKNNSVKPDVIKKIANKVKDTSGALQDHISKLTSTQKRIEDKLNKYDIEFNKKKGG